MGRKSFQRKKLRENAMASAPLSDPSARDLFAPDPGSGRKTLADRETAELVIGLVGPIGSGVSTAGGVIADVLETLFGYQTEHIDVSAVIEAAAPLVGDGLEEATTKAERIRALQRIGSRSRAALSESYLAQKVVERIALDREQGGWFEDTGFARPRRKVFIVDSLKHPAEIELLRDVYGDAFWLFGVFAPNDLRARRLRGKWGGGVDIPLIMRIDEAEGVEHGQKVRETMERADFFLRNDETLEDLRRVVLRFLDLIFAVGIGTPTRDEAAMYTAVSAATGSACLSRQVGAAI
jgi:dephospho-CoA kinase